MKDKKRLTQRIFLLNTFLFGLGAFGFFEQGKWIFGSVLTLVGLSNFYAFRFGENKPNFVNIGLNSLNAIVAGITAYDYYIQGTKGLHWMWILITVLYSLVTITFIIKKNRSQNEVA